jgi:spermidine/putrescine transport system permease protein
MAAVNPRVSYNERRKRTQIAMLVWPALLWLIIFFVVPLITVIAYSVLTSSLRYQAAPPFTFRNYETVLRETYTAILTRSIGIGLVTTFVCIIMGYPLAFFIATSPKKYRNVFLLMVIIPFWTNFLIRIYAWIFIIRDNGLVDSFVRDIFKLTDQPLGLLNTQFAVVLVMVYGFLPFMTLPIYTSIEKFNFRLIEAAHDLGANDLWAFVRIMLPVTLPGVLAGSILVFIPALGSYIVPNLVGGAVALMVGNQIYNFSISPTGKPLGAALAIVMMVVVVVALLINYRFADRNSSAS